MAFGVMREAHARRIDVPGTLSICGFDDTPASQLVSPGLSPVHQPCREMGRMAAEHVLLSIEDVTFKRHTTIPFQVGVRDSTAAPESA